MVKKYGSVFEMGFGPTRGIVVACPQLMEEIIRYEDPVPLRREPMPWSEYLHSNNIPTALLTS